MTELSTMLDTLNKYEVADILAAHAIRLVRVAP